MSNVGVSSITVTMASNNAPLVQNTTQLPIQLQRDVRYNIFVFLDASLDESIEVVDMRIGGKALEGTTYMRTGLNMVSATYRGNTIRKTGRYKLTIRLSHGDPIELNNAIEIQ
jgi:hypothetical protein